jgi:hypothetical protein
MFKNSFEININALLNFINVFKLIFMALKTIYLSNVLDLIALV